MPTLTQGSSVDITVTGDSTLTIQNPGGFATVQNPIGTTVYAGGGANTQLDVKGGVVRLTATTGGLFYEVVADTLSYPVTANSSGSLVVNGYASTQNMGPSVVIFGDSMTHRCNNFPTPTSVVRTNGVAVCTLTSHGLGSGKIIDFNNATDSTFNVRNVAITRIDANTFSFPAPGPDGTAVAIAGRALICTLQEEFRDDGYWFWTNAKIGGALRLVRNAGIASNTSVDMLARVNADVLAYQSDWVFFQPPVYNDVVNAGLSLAQMTANYAQILLALRNAGRKVLLIGPTAFNSGNTAALYQIWLGAHKWMRDKARTTPGVYFADVLRYQVNATAATPGNAISGMLASDNIHESSRGAERKAQAVVDAIGSLIPRINLLTSSSGDNYGTNAANANILDFAPWASSGGTVNAGTNSGTNSGTAPAGFQTDCNGGGAASTAVWSVPARSDGIGFDAQVVFTPAANNAFALLSLSSAIAIARAPAGSKLRVTMEIALTNVSGSNLRTINALLQFSGGGNATGVNLLQSAGTASSNWLQADGTFTFVSQDVTVPSDSGITGINLQIYFVAGAAGTAVTCKVGRISIEKVS